MMDISLYHAVGLFALCRRDIGLQVEAQSVSSPKGSFRRTIALESHQVQSVFLTRAEGVKPPRHIRRRASCLGELIVFHHPTKEDMMSVENGLMAIHRRFIHAESCLVVVIARCDADTIEVRMELIPDGHLVVERHQEPKLTVVQGKVAAHDGGRVNIHTLHQHLHHLTGQIVDTSSQLKVDLQNSLKGMRCQLHPFDIEVKRLRTQFHTS